MIRSVTRLTRFLLESIEFPETVISMAVEPETNAERKKLAETLARLARQDPTFTERVSEETGQTIISGMGELHLEVIRHRIQRDYGLAVRVHKPRVSYRESVRNAVDVTGEFQRTSAGVSQFARVRLAIEPTSDEQPADMENRLEPGSLTPALLESLEQSLHDEAIGGGALGYPLMNVRVLLLEVEAREGETTEVALQAAASDAMHRGLSKAGIVLLEPVMQLEVVTPDEFLGAIQADLNARHAMIINAQRRGRPCRAHRRSLARSDVRVLDAGSQPLAGPSDLLDAAAEIRRGSPECPRRDARLSPLPGR